MTDHISNCTSNALRAAAFNGLIWTGVDMLTSGGMVNFPQALVFNSSALFFYFGIQCPMEAVHGKRSAYHNVCAAGLMGYVGVSSGRVGLPFVGNTLFYRYPNLRPAQVGMICYGALGGLLAILGGKRFDI